MSRKKVTFTIEENVIEQLKNYSEETLVNRSRLIERLIVKYLNKEN
ncbi:hypothetical protein COB55_04460 [Candidatus Wolfebacteria bacterium]|nr:MAG: hypothetical protein COB55_04460 [Candidatus Wolfebacteria bacterium]